MGILENPEITGPIAGRYRVLETIGRGGMAMVYAVQDLTTGQRFALKRMFCYEDAEKQRRAVELFEREFDALAQLAHPRVVAVYDYGIDAGAPYYTMELLDGGDLQQLTPLDWRKACALSRDLCSTLSLLHSRRLVHRDLTPRNVRCTSDGLAKLIDFGGMVPMGVTKHLVGTAAFCAPEVVNLQEVDGRADLYSLGATLYYTLCGRRAYPVADFRQLREAWQRPPRRVSELVAGIPPALDELVMELLELDPGSRPGSAAEVMERLSAIANLSMDEQLLVSQAYLSTPLLVGRDEVLGRLRRRLARAQSGRGAAVMLQGPPGVGRSRLIDACALAGRLAGAIVLRADGADSHDGDYGVLRALGRQLLEAAPDAAREAAQPRLALLGHALPELVRERPDIALERLDAAELRPRLQAALRAWLLELARERLFVLAVDDVHRADEPSAALLALLAQELGGHRMLIVTSVDTDWAVDAPALALLAAASAKLVLRNLGSDDVDALLGSVFGAELNLRLLSDRLYAISDGNPRAVMRLAQHLVDKQIVRYQAGAWSLRGDIDPADLPSSMAEALKARVEALSEQARELACAAALSLGVRLRLDDCLVLLPQRTALRAVLDELCASQVLRMEGDAYVLAQQGWLPVLRATLAPEQIQSLHLRLAELYERRGDAGFRVAQHLLYAGETERALAALTADARASMEITDRDPEAFVRLLGSLPADWSATYTRCLELCTELGRPRRELITLLTRFSGLIPRDSRRYGSHVLALIDHFHRDSGLDLYHALDPSLPQAARLQQTFALVQRRHAESSERERGVEPLPAIGGLAQALVSAMGLVAAGHDHAFWAQLPSVSAYEPLSPALAMLEQLRHGLGARMTARGDRAREIYAGLLARMAQPDRGGLHESHHRYTSSAVMFALAILEASMGIASALDWAEQLEREPTLEVDAVLVRMLYHLWQGNAREAERCKRRVDVLRVLNAPRQMPEGTHLLAEVAAHAATSDLMRVKQTMDEIEPLARRQPGWVPIREYAAGEYQRLRGDAESALSHFEHGLACVEAGRHQAWPDLAGAHVRALLDLGRWQEARAQGERYLAAAEQAELGHVRNYIRMPLSLAQARLGLHDAAARNAEASVRDFEQRGSGGLNLGVAYETWARVASLAHDQPLFERCAERCAELYRAGENRALSARYARLIQDAKQAELGISAGLTAAADFTAQPAGDSVAHVTSIMESCTNSRERARCALQLLVRQSGAHSGWLYGGQDGVLVSLGQLGPEPLPANIDQQARGFLLAQAVTEVETQDGADVQTALEATAEWEGARGERYRPVLLAHPTAEGLAVLALAVLLVEPGGDFQYPGDMAAEVSRLVHEADASTVFALVS